MASVAIERRIGQVEYVVVPESNEGCMKHADRDYMEDAVNKDVTALAKAEESYGASWKLRGGVGAFMMLARKWDRLENQCSAKGYDIFEAINHDGAEDGILDDLRDLRRYLLLVEQECCAGAEPQGRGYVDQG